MCLFCPHKNVAHSVTSVLGTCGPGVILEDMDGPCCLTRQDNRDSGPRGRICKRVGEIPVGHTVQADAAQRRVRFIAGLKCL